MGVLVVCRVALIFQIPSLHYRRCIATGSSLYISAYDEQFSYDRFWKQTRRRVKWSRGYMLTIWSKPHCSFCWLALQRNLEAVCHLDISNSCSRQNFFAPFYLISISDFTAHNVQIPSIIRVLTSSLPLWVRLHILQIRKETHR